MDAVRREARRVQRREVGLEEVVRVREPGVHRVQDERPENEDDDRGLEPPQIFPFLRPMPDARRDGGHRFGWWAVGSENAKF